MCVLINFFKLTFTLSEIIHVQFTLLEPTLLWNCSLLKHLATEKPSYEILLIITFFFLFNFTPNYRPLNQSSLNV